MKPRWQVTAVKLCCTRIVPPALHICLLLTTSHRIMIDVDPTSRRVPGSATSDHVHPSRQHGQLPPSWHCRSGDDQTLQIQPQSPGYQTSFGLHHLTPALQVVLQCLDTGCCFHESVVNPSDFTHLFFKAMLLALEVCWHAGEIQG